MDHLELFENNFETIEKILWDVRFRVFQIVSYQPNYISKNLMEGYILTIWNSLDKFLRLLKKIPRNVPRKIPCFPDCGILVEAWLQ